MKIPLKRLYAYLYGYRQSQDMTIDIQRKYILENGKGKKSVKYIALGDSLTYGFGGSNYKGTFPYILSQKLLKKYRKVEIINLAICGARIEDLLYKQIPESVRLKPNFITILIGTNDVHNFTKIEKFRNILKNIIDQLKKKTDAQILIINIPYLITEYMTFPAYNLFMDLRIKKFNRVIEETANLKKVKYFDLYLHSKDYFKKGSSFYSSDWFHPSNKGYILWGNLIDLN
jgi:lysophospholipase L1-like esterase